MIPQRSLSLLANRLARAGGRRIPEAVLERDYCLAWLLVGLGRAALGESLAFKGGTALRRCYFPDYRFSEDLDFTLTTPLPFAAIRAGLEEVFAEVARAAGVELRYSRDDPRSHVNSHTFYVAYRGPLPPTRVPREVKVDVTVQERLAFGVGRQAVLPGYPEYADLPPDATVRAYSLPEIAAEKVVALLDRARTEPRDLYDVWYLTSEGHVDLGELVEAVERKLEFRQRRLADVRGELRAKEPRYRTLWSARLANQLAELPEFEAVLRAVQRQMRQAGLGGD